MIYDNYDICEIIIIILKYIKTACHHTGKSIGLNEYTIGRICYF